MTLPESGGVFLSIRDEDKEAIERWPDLHHMGFEIYATTGTHKALELAGIPSTHVFKVKEVVPTLWITPRTCSADDQHADGQEGVLDERVMRLAGLRYGVPCITTMEAAEAVLRPPAAFVPRNSRSSSSKRYSRAQSRVLGLRFL